MGRRRAFTLVELLVVIVVVGILAGLSLGALNMARESARVSSTKATIAKIDDIVAERYGSYLDRRLPLTAESLKLLAGAYSSNPKTVARVRTNAIRDMMRMEMPDRWSDVANADGSIRKPMMADKLFALSGGVAIWTQPTQMHRHYGKFRHAIFDEHIPRETVDKYGAAECLYSIVTTSPEASGRFRDNEIGDADGDGLREFHDSWGRPIMFVRWPAGFLQGNKANTDAQTGTDVDPFDVTEALALHYCLVPLVFSAGPDGGYDIHSGPDCVLSPEENINPYATVEWPIGDGATIDVMAGQPIDLDSDGNESWHDNIHSHQQWR